jgi:hypothetical protein
LGQLEEKLVEQKGKKRLGETNGSLGVLALTLFFNILGDIQNDGIQYIIDRLSHGSPQNE